MNNLKSWLFGLTLFSYTALFATPITVPTSLSPGDMYRLIFVTSTTTTATSTDISTYNAFVQGVADSQAELNALGATWTVVGSVSGGVNARENTNTDAGDTDYAIYNVNDQLISSTNAGLWDGSIDNPIAYDQTGTDVGSVNVFTGTELNGSHLIIVGNNALGDAVAGIGQADLSSAGWVVSGTRSSSNLNHLYAISSVLTVPGAVVPEPGTYLMLGSTLLIATHLKKKKKA